MSLHIPFLAFLTSVHTTVRTLSGYEHITFPLLYNNKFNIILEIMMTTPLLTGIQVICITFEHKLLNLACGDILPRESLIEPNDHKTLANTLVEKPYDILKVHVTSSLLNGCSRSSDPNRVKLIFNHMSLIWKTPQGRQRRLGNDQALRSALIQCDQDQQKEFEIIILTGDLFFHPDFTGYNMDHISDLPFVTQTGTTSTAPTASTSNPPSLPAVQTANIFNYNALPPDVRVRFDQYYDANTINQPQDMVPYSTGQLFYSNAAILGSNTILQCGALIDGTFNQKGYLRDTPVCQASTSAALRTFYDQLANHAYGNGYYIPPYSLLTKGHGGSDGFHFTIDLPDSFRHRYFKWNSDLLRILQKTTTFPQGSDFSKRAKSATNGFHALHSIISDSHPNFVPQPILLAIELPKQKPDQDLFDFHHAWLDHFQLRAIFLSSTDHPDSDHFIDAFIHRCQHGAYLSSCARLDCLDSTKKDLFLKGSLPSTLNNYLQNSDSPTKSVREGNTPSKPFAPRRPFNPYNTRRVNELSTDDPLSYESLLAPIIHQLTEAPPSDRNYTCTVCSENHAYNACPILNNVELCKSFCIGISQTISRQKKSWTQGPDPRDTSKTRNFKTQELQGQHSDTPSDSPLKKVPPDTAKPSDFHPGGK